MSFEAYLTNIEHKTGHGPASFRRMADERGLTEAGVLLPTVKAASVVEWLKTDFGLGHGHAMAIYALLKGRRS